MASKFRRTLSLEDLVNGSDDEMEELLSPGETSQPSVSKPNSQNPPSAMKNGMRVGTLIAPGQESPDNDDFFLTGPQRPILNLDTSDFNVEIDPNQNLPRSKSVRFQEPETDGPLGKVRAQVDEVSAKMKDNVARLLDREANLGSLQDLSEQLQYSSDIYRQSSEHLRRKLWWRQQRTRMILAAVFVIGIVLLIIPVVTKLLQ